MLLPRNGRRGDGEPEIRDRRGISAWIIRVALVLVSLAVPLIGLEALLRTVGPVFPGNFVPYLYLEPHPVYGFFHVPSTSSWLKTDEYLARVTINSRGLRERELSTTKPAGTRRVLVVGDSFIEGAQVDARALATTLLEALLRRETGQEFQVLNAGVGAWGTAQEYQLIRHEGLQYEPDLVVLAFYTGNDVTNNSTKIKRVSGQLRKPYFDLTDRGELRELPFTVRPSRPPSMIERLRRDVLVFGLLEAPFSRGLAAQTATEDDDEAAERQLISSEIPVFSASPDSRWEDAWRVTEAILGRTRDLVQQQGAEFLLVNVPTKWEIYDADWEELRSRNQLPRNGWDLNGPNQRIRAIAERTGARYLDLRPSLQAAVAGPRLYFHRDIHWTAAGHQVAAEALAAAVMEMR